MQIEKISSDDFERVFQEPLSRFVLSKIEEYNFEYAYLSPDERDGYLRRMVDVLLDDAIVSAGEHRISDWETGWAENYDLLSSEFSLDVLVPKYFGKYPVVRWNQQLIRPISPDFEYRMFRVIQDWLFDKYARTCDSIYEFGCGTGHNLIRLREFNASAMLWGLDWASSSQHILNKVSNLTNDPSLFSSKFDYFNPNYDFEFQGENTLAYTVASLEQIGTRFEPFIDFLLEKKPKLCVHIEPIAELLDEKHLIDYLSIQYIKKRNYLQGFYNHLRRLESENRVKIHSANRTFVGSLFLEGYSVIVWSPV